MRHPTWSLHEPAVAEIETFLARQQAAEFGYAARGASENGSPEGYNLDHNRLRIGAGERDFATACAALRRWEMFPRPWTRIAPADAPIRVGQTVAMIAHAFGWWMSACRIVYVIDEALPHRRWGFAYGTLEAHVEEGEERFSVELLSDDSVWFDLRAFSRPRHPLVRLAKPLARRLQWRFVRESQHAMTAAVKEARLAA